MGALAHRLIVAVLVGCVLAVRAAAAPDASCAAKFIGTWTVHILATGQTYPAVILPGGTTHVTCPMCTPTATWTCNGDTITVFVNGITVSHTLAAGGRTMSGSGATLTRIGPPPAVATPAPQQQANTAEKKLASQESKKPPADQKTAALQKPFYARIYLLQRHYRLGRWIRTEQLCTIIGRAPEYSVADKPSPVQHEFATAFARHPGARAAM